MFTPSAPSGYGGDQRAAVGHAGRCHEGDLELIRGARQQDEFRHVVFAGVAAAFEAVDAGGVAADRRVLQRAAHRCALVDHLDAGLLQHRQPFLRVIAGRLDRLDAAVDDGRM